ncbi:MAG TPA: spore coat U domain-containing protein [Steroidobacteraceae bacterium]|nr:spore coat U domain-containing protein [Steroidobacteraceae bacterium]
MSARAARRSMAPALLACAALALLGGSPARAGTITSCTVSAIGVAFGNYTPLQAAPLDMNGTINITCTGVTGRNTVTIDLSTGSSNSYMPRKLTAGTYTLNYNLYFDAAYTQIWGNGTGGSVVGNATIRRRTPSVSLPVYGAVAAGQDPAPGSYGDTILVSVNY